MFDLQRVGAQISHLQIGAWQRRAVPAMAFIPAIPLSLRARSALPTQTPPPPCPLAPASLSHPHLVSQRQSPTLTARPSSWTSSAKAFAWVHRVWRGPRSHLFGAARARTSLLNLLWRREGSLPPAAKLGLHAWMRMDMGAAH